MSMSKAIELQKEIEKKTRRQTDLLGELERSLLIKQLWPQAFKHGSCKSGVRGRPDEGYTFKITAGNGEFREFDLVDVPESLWPKDIQWRGRGTYGNKPMRRKAP